MANKIIKYTLESTGTVPPHIADGGYHGKLNTGTSPQDFDFIGVTVDGSNQLGMGEFTSEAAIESYLDGYTSSWRVPGPSDPSSTVAFDQAAAAAALWAKKTS